MNTHKTLSIEQDCIHLLKIDCICTQRGNYHKFHQELNQFFNKCRTIIMKHSQKGRFLSQIFGL